MSSLAGNARIINAMDLRSEPGTYLDRVDYRNEAFIINRAGRPKAVLVSVREYEQLVRQREEAKKRFWELTDEVRARTSQFDPGEVQAAIDKAVEAVRKENVTTE